MHVCRPVDGWKPPENVAWATRHESGRLHRQELVGAERAGCAEAGVIERYQQQVPLRQARVQGHETSRIRLVLA
jgi:hypothetical protein